MFSKLNITYILHTDIINSALLTNPFLLIAIGVIVGGFTAIQRFAADPLQVGEHVITQKGLYGVLVVLGLVLFWIAAPLSIVSLYFNDLPFTNYLVSYFGLLVVVLFSSLVTLHL